MLAYPKMKILPAWVVSLKISGARKSQSRLVRGSKVSRAAQEPGNILREHIQYFARRVAPGYAFRISRKHRQVPIPSLREVAPLDQLDFRSKIGIFGPICLEELTPFLSRFRAARANTRAKVLVHSVGNKELCILGPAVASFAKPNLVVAERLPMSSSRVLFVRRTVTDMA